MVLLNVILKVAMDGVMISISHKIELVPNNKQKTYFRKAFGCARLAYNWALTEWFKEYKSGKKIDENLLLRRFNSIRVEKFPFISTIPFVVVQRSIMNLGVALKKFYKNKKRGVLIYPRYKQKKFNSGSFYIPGRELKLSYYNGNSKSFIKIPHNHKKKRQYLFVPKLGWVKMTEKLRFKCTINNVVISQVGSRFYASFSVRLSEEEYRTTHIYNRREKKLRRKGEIIGIDLGIKAAATLSNGISIKNPEPYRRELRKIKKLTRKLSHCVHPKTKEERLNGVMMSKNYLKVLRKLCNAYKRVANVREDFQNKVTSIIMQSFKNVVVEDLNVKTMTNSRYLMQRITDVGFYEFRQRLDYKAKIYGTRVIVADKYFPSSKRCSLCGNINKSLVLRDRIFICPKCGLRIDRDYNAARNLHNLLNEGKIGVGCSELKSVDMTALLSLFEKNGIETSMSEAEMQQET